MKLLLIFTFLSFTLYSQSNFLFNFSMSKEYYEPHSKKSSLVPSLGFGYELEIDSFLIIGLKTDYEFHSVYLDHNVIDPYQELRVGYYDATFRTVEPQIGFIFMDDYSIKTGLAFHYLTGNKQRTFSYENSGTVFSDFLSFTFSLDKSFKSELVDFKIGFRYDIKGNNFSIGVPTEYEKNYQGKSNFYNFQSAFRINLGINLYKFE